MSTLKSLAGTVFDEYRHSSLVSSFSIHPEGLVSSYGKPVVGVQVRLLDTGYINVVCMKFFCKRKFLVVDAFSVLLEDVEGS